MAQEPESPLPTHTTDHSSDILSLLCLRRIAMNSTAVVVIVTKVHRPLCIQVS